MTIGGSSSGANLSAATISYLNGLDANIDEGDLAGISVRFSGALLLYGVYDFPLLQEPGSFAGNLFFWLAYLGPQLLSVYRDPLISPIYAPNLNKFPPTYLSSGDEDSALNQSLAMTKALTRVDVPTTLSVVAGVDHEFLLFEDNLKPVTAEYERIIAWLKNLS